MLRGFVYLVGAGPGDQGLLTLKGRECILNADVVVYDRLVHPTILAMIPRDCEKIDVGKTSGHHPIPQEQINEILLTKAKEGKNVVRLKGGDPFVFGRGAEELELLAEHQISFGVVPGVTSAISALAYAGIPVSHRDYSSSIHLITGHQKRGTSLKIDYEALVRTGGTLVFLMSLGGAEEIQKGLLEAGMPETMPAAIVENGTWENQRSWQTTLGELVSFIKEKKVQSPAIWAIGSVCLLKEQFSWFPPKKLRVLVTRPFATGGTLKGKLERKGIEADLYPCIETFPLEFSPDFSDAHWILFTSAVGVEYFFQQLHKEGKDSRSLGRIKIAAVGPGTAKELNRFGITADFVPSTYDGFHLATELIQQKIIDFHEKILLFRAEKGGDELPEILKHHGYSLQDIPIYRTEWVEAAEVSVKDYDWVTFTSESCVEGFCHLNPELDFSHVRALCIGERTGKLALNKGMDVVVAEKATIDSMVDKILEVCEKW